MIICLGSFDYNRINITNLVIGKGNLLDFIFIRCSSLQFLRIR